MDRNKSTLKPRHLIICVTTCTIAALWAVLFAALYFYFWGGGPPATRYNETDSSAMPRLEPLPWYLNGSIHSTVSSDDDTCSATWGGGPPATRYNETDSAAMPRFELLPWYLNGSIHPSVSSDDDSLQLWPHQLPGNPLQRLRNQLMFLPRGSSEDRIVLFWSDWSPREVDDYKVSQCPIKSCAFTNSRKSFSKASAVVFRNPVKLRQDFPSESRPRSQVWVFNSLQVPGESFIHPRDVFNWTATPRLDSDIPMFPHGVWMYFSPQYTQQQPPLNSVGQKVLGAAAWFPPTCAENTPSYRYVRKLLLHTSVDAYGSSPPCDSCPQNRTDLCYKLLKYKYRVTLVLQDRSCNNSIPQMFYLALQANTVPVVNAPPREVYEQVVPQGSFIHTDDFSSPRELAKHLEKIYEDDNLFNSYLSWQGTGIFVKSWYCRLCAMLHHNHLPEMTISDINEWWNPEGECTS